MSETETYEWDGIIYTVRIITGKHIADVEQDITM